MVYDEVCYVQYTNSSFANTVDRSLLACSYQTIFRSLNERSCLFRKLNTYLSLDVINFYSVEFVELYAVMQPCVYFIYCYF